MREVGFRRKIRILCLIAVCVAVGGGSLVTVLAQEPTSRGVVLAGSKTELPPASPGAYYALVIGINDYHNLPKLDTPVSDAKAVKEVLESRYGFQVQLLADATRYQILSALSEYRAKLHENDSLLVYYAGHGQYDPQALKGYWLPVDAERDDDANWIIADQITSGVRALQARHVLVVSDSCFSGMLTRSAGATMRPLAPSRYLEKMQAGKSRNLMASGGNEPVADGGAPGHSVFANALLQGLGDMEEGSFTALDLFNTFVQRRVVGGSEQVPEYVPIPNSGDEEGDFVFFRAASSTPATRPTTSTVPTTPPQSKRSAEPVPPKPAVPAAADSLSEAKRQIASRAYVSAFPLFQKAAGQGSAEAMVFVGDYYNKYKTDFAGVPKDDVQAVNWYRKAADAGSATGMTELGSLYQAGRGVEEDAWQAMRWYRKAAEADDKEAMTKLGAMYERGTGIELDFRQALSWYTKAADAGDALAMVDLGRMYSAGRGVEQDSAQAANWYGKALASYRRDADAGDERAMEGLASMYLQGLGVEKDAVQALNWSRRAADTGDSYAARILGDRFERGVGAEKDPVQAVTWYRKAAEAGNWEGMLAMARVYESGIGVEKDNVQAVTWYRKAAEVGSLSAMVALVDKYQNGDGVKKNATQAQSWIRKIQQTAEAGGVGTMLNVANTYAHPFNPLKLKPDYIKAAEWYCKAAEAGDSFAMMTLGEMYEEGQGVEKDDAQALTWYRKAANDGKFIAMVAIGRMYLNGKGVQKDDAEALVWFRKSAVRGDPQLMFRVGRAYESGGHDSRVSLAADNRYRQALIWYGKSALLGYAPAMVALGSYYERGYGVERDLTQAAGWYRKAACAGDSDAAAKLQTLGANVKDANYVQPTVPAKAPVKSELAFAGTWMEIDPRDSAHPRKLVLQQDGEQVVFAGFRLTLDGDGVATWTGSQGCAPRFRHSGYNYVAGGAGTATLKMSLQGKTLVYENRANWTSPCNGHPIGREQIISKFERADFGSRAAQP